MGEMATGIAHELKQPLGAIATYSYIAKSIVEKFTSSPHKLQEILGKLEEQSIRAGDIVRQLRSFGSKSKSIRVPVDLNTLVRNVAEFVELDIRQAEAVLTMKFDEPSPGMLIDEIQIQQVLVNLIRNSIDAMQETPTSRREVTVSTRTLENGSAEVTVSDSGQGLTEHEIDQVFEAFFSTKQEGMGMGLAISRSIVEAHGGQLWAKPNSDHGVTFGFTIPLENGHAQ
jgi:two-component system sensor kinase FixL